MGLGPIGLRTMASALAHPGTRLVAAVDVDPALLGRDVGELAGLAPTGVAVSPDLVAAGPPGTADVVLHCTGSHLSQVADQIVACVGWGASVVSSCEELSYPWFHHPAEARRIDDVARGAGTVAIGTGVNPGFAMDALAMAVSGIADRVDSVEVRRVVDAGTRRGPLQMKVGAGITEAEFASRKAEGRIGHVGLVESVAMVGAGLGWELDRIDESLDPVLAQEAISTDIVTIDEGRVAGIHHRSVGWSGDRRLVDLDLKMYVGAPDAGDTIRLAGDPPMTAHIDGLHGDIATAAIVGNVAQVVGGLHPGLRTMLDLQLLRARGT
jgi:4-hydroxy-tetrahydrodipicolinate reductase